jgi:hypothetical protein
MVKNHMQQQRRALQQQRPGSSSPSPLKLCAHCCHLVQLVLLCCSCLLPQLRLKLKRLPAVPLLQAGQLLLAVVQLLLALTRLALQAA